MSRETRSRPTAPIAAIVLDMDGLLVDSETVAGEALRLFLLGHGHEMLPSTLEGALGRRLPEAMATVAAAYDLSGPLDELIVAFDAMRLEALRGNVLAMPGAVALLDWAAGKGVPRALATSSFRGHAEVSLAEAALTGRFDVEVTGEEVERGKPAPDLFLLAAARLGISPESCVVFERCSRWSGGRGACRDAPRMGSQCAYAAPGAPGCGRRHAPESHGRYWLAGVSRCGCGGLSGTKLD